MCMAAAYLYYIHVCVCVCVLYKSILVAVHELCRVLRASEGRGAVQILIIVIIIGVHSVHH